MKPQLLIFDLDGTLIDSRRDLAASINFMRKHYGLPPLPLATVSGFVGDGIRKLVERSLAGQKNINLDEAVRLDYRHYLRHLHDKTVLYPGVAAGLKKLHKHGHLQALISNKGRRACLKILEHFELEQFFSHVIGGDSRLPLKPAPDTVLATMRKLKANAENTWVIGDNHTDLAAARNAKVKSIFVGYGIGKTGVEKPFRRFDDFNSLTEYFTA